MGIVEELGYRTVMCAFSFDFGQNFVLSKESVFVIEIKLEGVEKIKLLLPSLVGILTLSYSLVFCRK